MRRSGVRFLFPAPKVSRTCARKWVESKFELCKFSAIPFVMRGASNRNGSAEHGIDQETPSQGRSNGVGCNRQDSWLSDALKSLRIIQVRECRNGIVGSVAWGRTATIRTCCRFRVLRSCFVSKKACAYVCAFARNEG